MTWPPPDTTWRRSTQWNRPEIPVEPPGEPESIYIVLCASEDESAWPEYAGTWPDVREWLRRHPPLALPSDIATEVYEVQNDGVTMVLDLTPTAVAPPKEPPMVGPPFVRWIVMYEGEADSGNTLMEAS